MSRNPIERALGVWSTANYRDVMLPGLGAVTCGQFCDAMATEALSRTGTAKVLPRPDAVSMTCGTICLEYEDRDRRDAAYDWLENHAYAPLSALEPAASEGQQEASDD